MAGTEQSKLKGWRNSFAEPQSDGLKAQKRLQEIEVLLSELSSLKPGVEVYKGGENSILFRADLTSTKAQLKQEQLRLKKKIENKKPSSEALSF